LFEAIEQHLMTNGFVTHLSPETLERLSSNELSYVQNEVLIQELSTELKNIEDGIEGEYIEKASADGQFQEYTDDFDKLIEGMKIRESELLGYLADSEARKTDLSAGFSDDQLAKLDTIADTVVFMGYTLPQEKEQLAETQPIDFTQLENRFETYYDNLPIISKQYVSVRLDYATSLLMNPPSEKDNAENRDILKERAGLLSYEQLEIIDQELSELVTLNSQQTDYRLHVSDAKYCLDLKKEAGLDHKIEKSMPKNHDTDMEMSL